MTKCTVCDKCVCESCNDICASKFKQLTNKCKSIHFLCKTCEENIDSACETSNISHNTENSGLISTLKKMFEKKVNQIEEKIEKVIDTKVSGKLDAIASLNEKIGKQSVDEVKKVPYSKILEVPARCSQGDP